MLLQVAIYKTTVPFVLLIYNNKLQIKKSLVRKARKLYNLVWGGLARLET